MGKNSRKNKKSGFISEFPSFSLAEEIDNNHNFDESFNNLDDYDKTDFINHLNIHKTVSKNNTEMSPAEKVNVSNEVKDRIPIIKNNNEKKLSLYELAKMFSTQYNFAIMDNCLFHGNDGVGYYSLLSDFEAEKMIRKNTPHHYKSMINRGSIKEIIGWLNSFEDLQVSDEELSRNKYHINFSNGVLDVIENQFLPHSLKYYFTSYIKAEYPKDSLIQGNNFEKFMVNVVNGDVNLYMRIQEVFGYIISEIRDIKQIVYFVGKKDSGKSIMLNLLEQLIGKDGCSHVSLSDFSSPFSLSRLHNKKLNTCGETAELTLTRLDLIKSATGNDPLTGEQKYQNQFEFTNQAAMVFAGNDLPNTKGVDKMNAFIERLLIIPFDNQISKEKQDINLLEKLKSEKSYISMWAVEGLQRLISNNFIFTESEKANLYLAEYLQEENSFEEFVNIYCNIKPNKRIHSYVLREEYENYCMAINVTPVSEKVFHKKLQEIKGVKRDRFRINGDNRKGYSGIELNELITMGMGEGH
ncbi:DNA primase family protein [Planococcus salinarum]|uniref:DNA primase family protein n=1 Tax=Planococcus salinarum TaxID=622695 RepID=UPI00163D6130|nr:phage/plasmid primase, P4 family [Planococcus salinarum]